MYNKKENKTKPGNDPVSKHKDLNSIPRTYIKMLGMGLKRLLSS